MMDKLKEYWRKPAVKNLVFLAFLAVAYFTDFPKWINVQVRSVTLSQPDITPANERKQVFVSDAELLNAQGESVRLSAYKGQPMLVNFWASWCVPCLAEFPSLEELETELGDQVAFLYVTNENQEAFDQFLADRPERSSFYRQLTRMPAPFEHQAIPATFLLNADGEVVYSKFGAAKWSSEETVAEIKRLLELP